MSTKSKRTKGRNKAVIEALRAGNYTKPEQAVTGKTLAPVLTADGTRMEAMQVANALSYLYNESRCVGRTWTSDGYAYWLTGDPKNGKRRQRATAQPVVAPGQYKLAITGPDLVIERTLDQATMADLMTMLFGGRQ